jgi:hypothetical protein
MQRHLRVIEDDVDGRRPPRLSLARLLLVSEHGDRRIPVSQPLLGARGSPRRCRSQRRKRSNHWEELSSTHRMNFNRASPRPEFFVKQIYLDANHGFLDQYPELFADRVRTFLNG